MTESDEEFFCEIRYLGISYLIFVNDYCRPRPIRDISRTTGWTGSIQVKGDFLKF